MMLTVIRRWEMDGDKARTAYVSGSACSFIFNGGGHIGRIQNDMTLVDPGFQELLLPALDAGKGSRGYMSEPMFWGTTQIAGMKNNNPVAAARVLNYLTSPEGLKLTAIGIEGRDYEMKDGEIALLDQRTKDGFPTEAGDTGAHPLALEYHRELGAPRVAELATALWQGGCLQRVVQRYVGKPG